MQIDPHHIPLDLCGQSMGARNDRPPAAGRSGDHEPAREMRRTAAHSDFTVDDSDRRYGGVEFAADTLKRARHRHERALYKTVSAATGLRGRAATYSRLPDLLSRNRSRVKKFALAQRTPSNAAPSRPDPHRFRRHQSRARRNPSVARPRAYTC